MKQQFILRNDAIRHNAIAAINALLVGDGIAPMVVEIKPLTRTLEHSARLHAMFGELSKKAQWQGEWLQPEQWKVLMISGHSIATGEPVKLTLGVEKELVNIRESSATMSGKRMASLIEYIACYAAENDIKLSR
jgi:hypothetical protein